jgi:hypothetical protein
MKILILVTLTVWSFGSGYGGRRDETSIVSSPEEAAIIVWEKEKRPSFVVEPDRYVFELWEVDLSGEKKTVKQIPIPKVSFSDGPGIYEPTTSGFNPIIDKKIGKGK